ncbi:MAG: hypothetical protein IKA01_09875 [Alistipes sp.]|nr:hypothetical protein [Alistipes sp.]
MGRVAGTVSVTIGFDNEDVLTEDSFYTKLTPRITVGRPRFKQDQIKLAIIEDVIKKKIRIKAKGKK